MLLLVALNAAQVVFGFVPFAGTGRVGTERVATIEPPLDTKIHGHYDPRIGENAPLAMNDFDKPWVKQMARPRRNRKSEGIRAMVRETSLTAANLLQPLFIHEDDHVTEIESMPGCVRHSLASMVEEVRSSLALGVKSFVLFPKIADDLKSNFGQEAHNEHGLVPRAVKLLKKECPEAVVVTDIALDPYSNMGHDGVVVEGEILNDVTVQQLIMQAVCHARAGADVVAPSDMMDGRIGAIRKALDALGFTHVSILSYSAKYASAFYGPFRDALDSHPGFGDKKTYQMDPANGREALIEASLDAAEGADMLMVKPGLPYLDIVYRIRHAVDLPMAVYHVSGEYAMLKAAAQKGWIDEKAVVLETLLSFRRAGADVILTYYAKTAAQWLRDAEASSS
ncbi:hypothetical protein CTAYLR_006059 [Chrysophaeum taylorii]|uniref:Delta-aminolevulinic acid dehydratase n=1 Tax=Chrysophaeum taylorii TaxID=2483200 RepID=A0AAD7UJZ7_9STRA|nr:hypothetical protein CTAYLR_006059 [Chrysophaeum taylorii]